MKSLHGLIVANGHDISVVEGRKPSQPLLVRFRQFHLATPMRTYLKLYSRAGDETPAMHILGENSTQSYSVVIC